MDTWNTNQITIMRHGDNRNLHELLEVYGIDRFKIDKKVLYSSRLLEFYRQLLKSKLTDKPFEKIAPNKEEALKSYLAEPSSSIYDPNKYGSISSTGARLESSMRVETDLNRISTGFIGDLNRWMAKPVNSVKFIANKVGKGGFEIGSRIISTTQVMAQRGSDIVTKGTEAAVTLLNSRIRKKPSLSGKRPTTRLIT